MTKRNRYYFIGLDALLYKHNLRRSAIVEKLVKKGPYQKSTYQKIFRKGRVNHEVATQFMLFLKEHHHLRVSAKFEK